MIPAWALRFAPHIGIVMAIISAVWWIDHRGYQRAAKAAEQRQLVDAIVAERKTRRIEQAMSEAVAAIDGRVGNRIAAVRILRQTVVQPIQKELNDDPRYSDPACAVSDSVRNAINAARAASGSAGAAASITVPLPAPAADP